MSNFMKIKLLILMLCFLAVARAEEALDPRVPATGIDGKIVDLIIVQVEKDENGRVVILRMIGINSFEQVSFLVNQDADNNALNKIRIGPQYVNNVMTRVINQDGVFRMEFLPLSAGSGLVIVGKDKSIKNLEVLPLGLVSDFKNPEAKFVLIARLNSNKEVPLTADAVQKWADINYIKEMIKRGEIIVTGGSP